MPYATPTQFELALGAKETAALADPEAAGTPIAGRIDYALTLASADIDAILEARAPAIATAQPAPRGSVFENRRRITRFTYERT